MERWKLECAQCGNSAMVERGSYAGDQSYTDLNEDFALFRVFTCPVHRGWIYRNINDRAFDGSCGTDGGKLQDFDIRSGRCPRCGAAILSTKLEDQLME